MAPWTSDELDTIGDAEELTLASARRDGTLRNAVTMWVVRHRDDLYVRSVNGRDSSWFRGAQTRHEARIRAGGIEKDVRLIARRLAAGRSPQPICSASSSMIPSGPRT